MSHTSEQHFAAIVLAAGSARRMGDDKLLLPYKGVPLIHRTLTPLAACRHIHEIVVVTRPEFRLNLDDVRYKTIENAAHKEGMGTSLSQGVRAASNETTAFVLCLADMPEIDVDLLSELIDVYTRRNAPILVPVFQGGNDSSPNVGSKGHPVIFDRRYREELSQLRGQTGAREIIARHRNQAAFHTTRNQAVVFDIDTPDDLRTGRLQFESIRQYEAAQTLLRRNGVFFTPHPLGSREDATNTMCIEYHLFDHAAVAAIEASV